MWHRSQRAAYTWMREDQKHPYSEALAFFRDVLCERDQVWIAVEKNRVVGVLALADAVVDHLFIDPDFQGKKMFQI